MVRKILILCIVVLLVYACRSNQKESQDTEKRGMVLIPNGILHMGGDNFQADQNEYPKHNVTISKFWLDEAEVSNTDFLAFVQATKYITIAERPLNWEEMKTQLPPNTPKPADSLLLPGALVFQKTKTAVPLNNPSLWWKWTIGANWSSPYGGQSTINDIMDHPVVHIAWEDAYAYCKWAKKRLPTEAEWEWAARGGKKDLVYPWGNEDVNSNKPKANFYQGHFPYHNTIIDKYEFTSPVKSFEPNGYGLYDMAGNVWEWCNDWFDVDYYKKTNNKNEKENGPSMSYNPQMPFQQERVIRGGSFLCNDGYCSGYRNARRMGSTPDTGLNHTGFRCACNDE